MRLHGVEKAWYYVFMALFCGGCVLGGAVLFYMVVRPQ